MAILSPTVRCQWRLAVNDGQCCGVYRPLAVTDHTVILGLSSHLSYFFGKVS